MKKRFYGLSPEEHPDIYSWQIKSGGDKNLAVFKNRIAGRAIWTDRRYTVVRFFSDTLLARMRADGMEGWKETNYWEEL